MFGGAKLWIWDFCIELCTRTDDGTKSLVFLNIVGVGMQSQKESQTWMREDWVRILIQQLHSPGDLGVSKLLVTALQATPTGAALRFLEAGNKCDQ